MMLKKILLAVDGSEYSQKALEFACELTVRFDSSLHMVHIPQGTAADRVMVMGGASVMVHASRSELEEAGHALISAAKEQAEKAGAKTVTTEIRAGDPAEEIINSAKEINADTIILGSRGLGDFSGLLLGSISHKVNHTAPCTCITVH